MKLTELEPKWLNEHVFAFKCPHCRKEWLTCKNTPMSHHAQHTLFEDVFGDDWNLHVVGTRPEVAWSISGKDFATMSVTPSLDASPAGHWHGFITNGQIVGGEQLA